MIIGAGWGGAWFYPCRKNRGGEYRLRTSSLKEISTDQLGNRGGVNPPAPAISTADFWTDN